jgi:hypothetical protein
VTRLVAAFAVPVALLLAGTAWVPGVAGPASPERVAHTARPAPESLAVSIESMSPAQLPRRGPLVLRGTVTNTTDEPWIGLNIHPFTSYSPMRSAQQLEASAESDPEIYLGERIVTSGAFDDHIEELAPGATARWRVRIPQDVLRDHVAGTDGVYWVGVHALGADSSGRDNVADGRARTFISQVPPGARRVPTSLLVPIRRPVRHVPDGRLDDEGAWASEFVSGGRLSNILAFAESAGTAPVTFVVDPAVLDAAAQIAAGNPPRDLAPTTDQPAEQPTTETGDDADDEEDPAEQPTPQQAAAEAWLTRLTASTNGNRVLGLPYGDLDVAGAGHADPELYETARELSAATFEAAGITATPAIVPPSGVLSAEALRRADPDTAVLLSDEALPAALTLTGVAPPGVTSGGRLVDLYDAAASSGGPGPGDRLSAVALRQRTLAEAAVRALGEGDDSSLVVSLPHDFDPGPLGARFFRGLERPFLGLVPSGAPASATTPEVDELAYPERQEERELGIEAFAAAERLIEAGESVDALLAENDTVAKVTAGEALAGVSYHVRSERREAIRASQASAAWLRALLEKVTLDAPSFVILSAESGPFAVTVSNGLPQPVILRIEAHTRDDLVIRAPAEIELAPESRQTVNLSAQADSIGVHPVRLVATDEDGRPLGATEEISVRSNEVGRIIWVVMGVGVGILFLAVLVRLVRRFRGARAG